MNKTDKDERFKLGQKAARKSVAERGMFSLKLYPETILKIYDMADELKIPATTLVRSWIEEKTQTGNFK